MKKILFILSTLDGGGAERVALTVIRNLQQMYKVRLFVIKNSGVYWEEVPDNVEICIGTNSKKLWWVFPIVIIKLIKEAVKVDLIVGALEFLPTYIAVIVAKLTQKPVIGWVHISIDKVINRSLLTNGIIFMFFYQKLNKIVFPAEKTKNAFINCFRSIKFNKLIAIENIIDENSYTNYSVNGTAEWYSNVCKKNYIIGVGRLVDQKGFDILINSFSKLLEMGNDLNLLILGEGENRVALENLIKSLKIESRVFLPGHVKNIIPYLQKAKLFVLSSRYEGFGMVIVEAMMCGAPVLAFNCPEGPSEILEDGRYGRLVNKINEKTLCNEIHQLINNENSLMEYKILGLERAKNYKPIRVINKWKELINEYANQ